MNIINLTPHTLTIYDNTGIHKELLSIPCSGVARVQSRSVPVADASGIPIVRIEYGAVDGLPDPAPDTLYVVSIVVLQALRGARPDVVCPDTNPGSVVRDTNGQILGVKQLMVI